MPGNLTSDAFKHEIVQHESLHLPVQWLIHESDRLQQDVPKHWHEECSEVNKLDYFYSVN